MKFNLMVKEISIETYILTGKIYDQKTINNLIEFIKNNVDKELSHKTNVTGKFTGFDSLVNNKDFHNFLSLIKEEIKVINRENNFYIKHAWGNLCGVNEEVKEHDHRGINGFCGILYLTEGGPGTYFREYDTLISEEIGKFVLFDPLLQHSVKKIENNLERINIAFNMQNVKSWEDVKNETNKIFL
jgi:hypothetical protein